LETKNVQLLLGIGKGLGGKGYTPRYFILNGDALYYFEAKPKNGVRPRLPRLPLLFYCLPFVIVFYIVVGGLPSFLLANGGSL